MRESVPTARYSPVCNVLRQWKTSLILTYRVYRLYDYIHTLHPILTARRSGHEEEDSEYEEIEAVLHSQRKVRMLIHNMHVMAVSTLHWLSICMQWQSVIIFNGDLIKGRDILRKILHIYIIVYIYRML